MAKRIEGVTENLLNCATEEFLARGYADASLRTISQKAGTTPRSIYTRYGDKEGLFGALAEPAAVHLKELLEYYMGVYHKKPVEDQKKLFHDTVFDIEYKGYIEAIVSYMYDHWNECRLLICCSEGSKYAGFLDELVTVFEKYTLLYIDHTGNDVISSGRAKPELIHLLCSSFVHGFFEVVRHDMSRHDAIIYLNQLQEFYTCGWDNLFNPHDK